MHLDLKHIDVPSNACSDARQADSAIGAQNCELHPVQAQTALLDYLISGEFRQQPIQAPVFSVKVTSNPHLLAQCSGDVQWYLGEQEEIQRI